MKNSSETKAWRLSKTVLPQHTDHAGVMWHGAYVNWLEEARIEALSKVGLSYAALSADGFELPVVSLQIRYLNSVLHGDHVIIESRLLCQNRARWPWKSRLISDGKLISEATVELVLVRKTKENYRLIRDVPEPIIKAFLALKRGPNNSDRRLE